MQMELYYVVKVERVSENEEKATYLLGPFSSYDKASNEQYDYESVNFHRHNLDVEKKVVKLEEYF